MGGMGDEWCASALPDRNIAGRGVGREKRGLRVFSPPCSVGSPAALHPAGTIEFMLATPACT